MKVKRVEHSEAPAYPSESDLQNEIAASRTPLAAISRTAAAGAMAAILAVACGTEAMAQKSTPAPAASPSPHAVPMADQLGLPVVSASTPRTSQKPLNPARPTQPAQTQQQASQTTPPLLAGAPAPALPVMNKKNPAAGVVIGDVNSSATLKPGNGTAKR